MNPLLCASLTFLLTVSQAVAVVAKGKKSASKPKPKKPIPLIIAVVVAVVVVLVIIGLIAFIIWKRSRRAKMANTSFQPPDVLPYISGGHAAGHKEDHSPHIPMPTQFTPNPPFPTPHIPPHAGSGP